MLGAGGAQTTPLCWGSAAAFASAAMGTAVLRCQQIKLQLALANALMHTKGYAAPETKASFDQARLYIERAGALGEPPEDPLLLFSVLYGFWVANYVTAISVAISVRSSWHSRRSRGRQSRS